MELKRFSTNDWSSLIARRMLLLSAAESEGDGRERGIGRCEETAVRAVTEIVVRYLMKVETEVCRKGGSGRMRRYGVQQTREVSRGVP
jgi:hypothetical protein